MATHHVNPVTGSYANDGSAAGTPFLNIEQALVAADENDIISVAGAAANNPLFCAVALTKNITIKGDGEQHVLSGFRLSENDIYIEPNSRLDGTDATPFHSGGGSGHSVVTNNSAYGGSKECIQVTGASSRIELIHYIPAGQRFRLRIHAKSQSGGVTVQIRNQSASGNRYWNFDTEVWQASGPFFEPTDITAGGDTYGEWISDWITAPDFITGGGNQAFEVWIGAGSSGTINLQNYRMEHEVIWTEEDAANNIWSAPLPMRSSTVEPDAVLKSSNASFSSYTELDKGASHLAAGLAAGECWYDWGTAAEDMKLWYRLESGETTPDNLCFRAIPAIDVFNMASGVDKNVYVQNITTRGSGKLFYMDGDGSLAASNCKGFAAIGAMAFFASNMDVFLNDVELNAVQKQHTGTSDALTIRDNASVLCNRCYIHDSEDDIVQLAPLTNGDNISFTAINSIFKSVFEGGGNNTTISIETGALTGCTFALKLFDCVVWKDGDATAELMKITDNAASGTTTVNIEVHGTSHISNGAGASATGGYVFEVDDSGAGTLTINQNFSNNYNGGTNAQANATVGDDTDSILTNYLAASTHLAAIIDEFIGSDPTRGLKSGSSISSGFSLADSGLLSSGASPKFISDEFIT